MRYFALLAVGASLVTAAPAHNAQQPWYMVGIPTNVNIHESAHSPQAPWYKVGAPTNVEIESRESAIIPNIAPDDCTAASTPPPPRSLPRSTRPCAVQPC